MSPRPALATSAAVLLLLVGTPAGADDDVAMRAVPNMRVFADKDGVPQSSILAMAMEKDGRVWIGTQDGPAVHDGQGFVPVPLPSNAESVTVDAIEVAADGSVWLATDGGGVWRRAGDRWTALRERRGAPIGSRGGARGGDAGRDVGRDHVGARASRRRALESPSISRRRA